MANINIIIGQEDHEYYNVPHDVALAIKTILDECKKRRIRYR